jgi:hypothetical protein
MCIADPVASLMDSVLRQKIPTDSTLSCIYGRQYSLKYLPSVEVLYNVVCQAVTRRTLTNSLFAVWRMI